MYQLHRLGILNDIDIQCAAFLNSLAGDSGSDAVFIAAALTSNTTTDAKHTCLDLAGAADKTVLQLFPDIPESEQKQLNVQKTPLLSDWISRLQSSTVVGLPGSYTPLILDEGNRLYFYRFWQYEQQLACAIRQRLSQKPLELDNQVLTDGLRRYFIESPTDPDWQQVAAFTALGRHFTVITGGPGTGKTYTVTTIMALLLEQKPDAAVRLCAPTGKAAARLQDSVRSTVLNMPCSDTIRSLIPETASTIHRLLGSRPLAGSFVHNRGNPVAVDLLIVDEASMVPLNLMAKLLEAVPETASVILLGDKDQLASVEAGAILSDICDAAGANRFSPDFRSRYQSLTGTEIPAQNRIEQPHLLTDCTVELQHSYRFDSDRNIGRLSREINSGNDETVRDLLSSGTSAPLTFSPLPTPETVQKNLRQRISNWYAEIIASPDVQTAFEAYNRFRLLCSHRTGRYGAEMANKLAETTLSIRHTVTPQGLQYHGRPIIITENDYTNQLFNGDTGLIWNSGTRDIQAFFPAPGNTVRSIALSRLPRHQTAFAMTIHKSQGSEFDDILIILPDHDSLLLTRELLYTGITRARSTVELWADIDIIAAAVQRRTHRTSGLRDALTA